MKSFFSLMSCVWVFLILSCNHPLRSDESGFVFGVIDVGQGLSQIGICGSRAVMWDMGPVDGYDTWQNAYRKAGSPELVSVIISHRDLDHSGGLQFLDSSVKWSGELICSKYEDTSYIRSLCTKRSGSITIGVVSEGDVLSSLEDVEIRCIWPPQSIGEPIPVQDEFVNRYSLVFLVRYKSTQVIITSDIDSISEKIIVLRNGSLLQSQIMAVPHHGSAGSVNTAFFGFVKPDIAIISCARINQYGHPSKEILDLLMLTGPDVMMTYVDGTLFYRSNGFYLVRDYR